MDPARRAAPRVAWIVVGGAVAALAAAVPVAIAGGAEALPVSRSIVETLLVLSIAGVLGIVAVAATGLEADEEPRGRLLDLAAALAAAWTVLAAGTAFLLYLGQAPAPDSPAFGPGLVSFIADIEIGRTWAIAAGCAAVLTALLLAVRSPRGLAVLWSLSLAAVVPVALQAATAGQALGAERVLDGAGLVHLAALGTWIGALAVDRAGTVLPVAAAGAAAVATLAASPALVADGAVGPLSLAGGAAASAAGILAIVTAAARRSTRGAQFLLLGAALGLGVAQDVLRTMPAVPTRTTPAQILTGASLPADPSAGTVLGAWLPDPVWLVVAAGLLVGYGAGIRRRGSWPARRSVSWVAAVLLLVWSTSGAPAVYAPTLLLGVLVQTSCLLLLVPVLLAGGAPGRLVGGGLGAGPLRPVAAAVLAVLVPMALVGTDLLRWSVADPIGREATCVLVLAAGCLLVASLVRPGVRRGVAVGVPLALLLLETAAAAGLAFGPALLLADWYGAMGWGTDALAAQRASALPTWVLLVVPTALLLVRGLRTAPDPVTVAPEAAVA